MEEIQTKYNIANRRAIRAIMRAPIYVTNEGIEMELGVKKITDIYRKSVLNLIGKMYLSKGELHYSLLKEAIHHRTQTIRQWRKTLRGVGISDYDEID